MSIAPPEVRARAFEAWAEEYDRFRPGYPDALFELLTDRLELSAAATVVDLGAGTGKVALPMARRGWRVTAVDPGAGMLAVLRTRASEDGLEVESVEATAEATGLPAAQFDAAVAGEAYHWFDAPVALVEMGRIVRSGGGIAFFWNVIDEARSALAADEREMTRELGVSGAEVRHPGPNDDTREAIASAGLFEPAAFVQVPHVVPMSGAEYRGLAFTKSHLRTAPRPLQRAFGARFDAILAAHGVAPEDVIDVPYVVDCWLARRTGR